MTEEPLSEPVEEGNDQEVKEGAVVETPEEGDLSNAPDPEPNAPDDPENE